MLPSMREISLLSEMAISESNVIQLMLEKRVKKMMKERKKRELDEGRNEDLKKNKKQTKSETLNEHVEQSGDSETLKDSLKSDEFRTDNLTLSLVYNHLREVTQWWAITGFYPVDTETETNPENTRPIDTTRD